MGRGLLFVSLSLVLAASTALVPSGARPHVALTGPAPTLGSVASPAGGPTAGWPTYMATVERTGANHAETTVGVGTVAALRPLWSIASNGSDFSAPIAVGGTVYYGSWNGDEYAVNATTGTVLWSRFLGVDTACGGYNPMGISSTPAYVNGTLYLGGGDGYWYALNASTGGVDWRMLPGSEADNYYAWASALVYRGSLYVGTASCFDNPLVPAGLLKVNLSTHAVVAQFNASPVGGIGESIWSTPALDPANQTIWVTTGNENPPGYPLYANAVVALNATTLNVTGSWQVPDVAGQDSDFGSTATLFYTATGTPMVVASNKNGVAFALDRENVTSGGSWRPVWNLSTGGGFSGGAFDGQTLYLGGGSSVEAVVPSNGSVLWSAGMDGGGYIYGSLAWANGLVFAGGGNEVEAIDAANGTVLWNATLPGGEDTVNEPVLLGSELFVASGDYGSNGALTAYGLPGRSLFHLTITETGLRSGKRWTASVGGTTLAGTGTSIGFLEGNGSFPYLVRGPGGYQVHGIEPSGTVNVSGANVTLSVAFLRGPTPVLALTETGLPHLSDWCASLAGWSGCTDRGRLSLRNVTPGTYEYAFPEVAGFHLTVSRHHAAVAPHGAVGITGSSGFHLRFVEVTYALTFQETGLTPGTHWVVRLSGTVHGHPVSFRHGSTTSTIVFLVPNGTYSFVERPVRGYTGNSAGNVTVSAGPANVSVSFVPAAAPERPMLVAATTAPWSVRRPTGLP